MNLLLLLGLTHICFPRARRHTRKFFDLSYHNEATGRYALGWDDVFMVFHWIVVFTGLRVAVMEYILLPLAEYAGIGKKKERIRFAEQAWIFLYASAFWSLGMVSFKILRHIAVCLSILVHYVQLRLLARSSQSMDQLARSGNERSFQVVLSCTICVLVAANTGRQYRREEERLRTDVHTSYHHKYSDADELWLPLYKGGKRYFVPHGRCGYCATGNSKFLLSLLAPGMN